ncbi:MAG: NusA-like transcription termination signal-binding factor [archaeon]
MRIGNQQILYINALEDISGAKARDCVIFPNQITFLVRGSEIGKAIGKNGATIRDVRQRIGKNVEVLEWTEDPKAFLKKAIFPVKATGVELNGKTVVLRLDPENRRKMHERMNKLKRLKELMNRAYGVEEIRMK